MTEGATEISGYGMLQVEGTAGAKGPEAHELEKQGGQCFQNGKNRGDEMGEVTGNLVMQGLVSHQSLDFILSGKLMRSSEGEQLGSSLCQGWRTVCRGEAGGLIPRIMQQS